MPWIINTMGFSDGLGIHLMKKAVETFRPTTIVEIESRFGGGFLFFLVSFPATVGIQLTALQLPESSS